MTTEEYERYWNPAFRMIYGDINGADMIRLSEGMQGILGTSEFTDWLKTFPSSNDYPMGGVLKTKLEMLRGPHGKAIWEAIKIRKQHEEKETA